MIKFYFAKRKFYKKWGSYAKKQKNDKEGLDKYGLHYQTYQDRFFQGVIGEDNIKLRKEFLGRL